MNRARTVMASAPHRGREGSSANVKHVRPSLAHGVNAGPGVCTALNATELSVAIHTGEAVAERRRARPSQPPPLSGLQSRFEAAPGL